MKRYLPTPSLKLTGLIIWLLLACQGMMATHFTGVDIYYECIGPCTYRIYHRTYYDCTGGATQGWLPVNNPPNLPFAPTISFQGNGPGCSNPTPVGNWTFVGWTEVTPICPALRNQPPSPSYPSGCKFDPLTGQNPNPPVPGTVEAIFYRDYNFCGGANPCDEYTIVWSDCCRNNTITSLTNQGSIYTGATTIDLTITPCNSSPQFVDTVTGTSRPPIAYICEGQVSTFNQGAIDPDGDSLVYELGPCSANANADVAYDIFNGYSPTSPLGPTWNVQIDPVTGDITFTPSPTGAVEIAVICIVVKEYRNGQLIGQIVRDMQVTVLADCNSPTPLTSGATNVTLGDDQVPADPLSFSEIRTCAGTELCFDIPVIPQDTFTYSITWDRTIPGATFTDATNPTVTDTVTGVAPVGRFCWTPPTNLTGTFSFVVTIQDDACPIPGLTQFTILMYLAENQSGTLPIADTLGCNQVAFSLQPSSLIPGPYGTIIDSVSWFGNGNLDLNPNRFDTALNHFYPGPGNYFYNVFVQDTFGCSTQLSGSVEIPTYAAKGFAGSDVTICSNQPYQLGLPTVPSQTYSWTPSIHLDDTTLAQPTFAFPGPVSSLQTFQYAVTTQDTQCTTIDFVNVTVNPSVEATITPADPTICIGDSVTLTASANLGAGTTFLWSNGATTPSIRVGPLSNTTYSVVAFGNGCVSNPRDVVVNVSVGPQATITGDLLVCPNGGGTLVASGGVNYLWSVAGFSQPSITLVGITGDTTIGVIAFDQQGCAGPPTLVTVGTHPGPVADFFAPNECVGQEISFQDNSTIASGQLGNWLWDFGDGAVASGQNPTHLYQNPGTYNVLMTVRSDNGCEETVAQSVIVYPEPAVDFISSNVCEGGINDFLSTTTIPLPGRLSNYSWDFGDGSQTDGLMQTQHQYTSAGFYNVTLTATSEDGCRADFTKTIFVHPLPTAAFDLTNACEDSLVQFIDQSTVDGSQYEVNQWLWDFDPADPDPMTNSILQNPTYSYPSPGEYLVSLTVTTDSGCTGSIERPITIYQGPSVDFSYDQTCENEVTQFTGTASTDVLTPVSNWTWSFGEGTTQSSLDQSQTSFAYETVGPGTYEVYLAIETTVGCRDTVIKNVVINPAPVVAFEATRECLFDSTSFTDLTTLAYGNMFEWQYDFGDGQQTFEPNPDHFYFQPGIYEVTLTATTDSGCTNQAINEITVDPTPTFATLQGDSICFSDRARLLAVSNPTDSVSWYTTFDGTEAFHTGFSYITSSMPFTTTYYVQAISDQGCEGIRVPLTAYVFDDATLAIEASGNLFELPGAIVEFSLATTTDMVEYEWNFGDDFTSNNPAPVHEYEFAGIYEVTLTTTDANGCQYFLTTEIEVKKVDGIYSPSAFSPNGDGRNDLFRVGAYNVQNFEIKVFNRWGQKVYESQNPDFAWDGTDPSGNPIKEGVYVYTVVGFDINGNQISDTRTLTVIR